MVIQGRHFNFSYIQSKISLKNLSRFDEMRIKNS